MTTRLDHQISEVSRRISLALLLSAALMLPAAAHAGLCGDDVEGARVACSCGDTVVSDTTLRPSDPVTRERCPMDGLFVRAAAGAESIVLDLAGLSISGAGIGSGIRVLAGGDAGAVVTGGADGGAEVSGFSTGISGHGRKDVQELSGISARNNTREGIDLSASGLRLRDVTAERNGRDGFRLSGHDGVYEGLVARNNTRAGVVMTGSGSVLELDALNNGSHGARVSGRNHTLSAVDARLNGEDGLLITGTGHDLSGVRAVDNAGTDIARKGAGAVR